MRLLAERGYAALRIEDVSAATGHAKTTVYRRWPSLDHLVIAAMEQAVGDVPTPRGSDAAQRIASLIVQRLRVLDAQSLLGVALDLLRHGDDDLRRTYRERVIDPIRDEVIRLAETLDGVSVQDPAALADALIGGLLYRSVVLGEQVAEREIAEFVASLCGAGSAASATRGR